MRALVIVFVVGCFGPSPARNQRCDNNGWCPPPESCQDDGVCRAPGDPDAAFDAPPIEANKMFVTHEPLQLNDHDAAGLDAYCQMKADESGISGTFKAWISTSTDAITRLAPGNGWVRLDGKPFANTRASLAAKAVFYPPSISEQLADLRKMDITVATGTNGNGTRTTNNNCSDWTMGSTAPVNFGKVDGGSDAWTDMKMQLSCSMPMRLYCFGVDRDVEVKPPPLQPTQKRAFLTAIAYSPMAMGDADLKCREEAGDSGTWKALLAAPTASVKDRFPGSNGPWYRMDGVEVSADMRDLAAPLNVTFNGAYVDQDAVWVGAPGLDAIGVDTLNCNGWTDFTTGMAAKGNPTRSRMPEATSGFQTSQPCAGISKARFYCAEP